jgi:hypothetical protein
MLVTMLRIVTFAAPCRFCARCTTSSRVRPCWRSRSCSQPCKGVSAVSKPRRRWAIRAASISGIGAPPSASEASASARNAGSDDPADPASPDRRNTRSTRSSAAC